jgi:hypothetical protein
VDTCQRINDLDAGCAIGPAAFVPPATAVPVVMEEEPWRERPRVARRRPSRACFGVEVLIPTQSPAEDDPTGWATARALIGFIQDAPSDMAEYHDHYLYGRPRE